MIIFLGRYNILGFNNTFCLECSIYNVNTDKEAEECTSCLSKQNEYYRTKSTIESIEVTQDEKGRNVVKAVKLI